MISENLFGSGHTFLVDLARHQGDSQSLINSVNRYLRSKYPAAKVTWVARPDQALLLHDAESVVEANRFGTAARADDIKELILKMSRDGTVSIVFHVLTYDRQVLEAAAGLNELSLIVVPTHMNNIKDDRRGSRFAAPRPQFPQGLLTHLPLEEALKLAKQVLRMGGHTSKENALPLSKLRPQMAFLDGRARKNLLDPHSAQLITRVVAEGERRGWLSQFQINGQSGSERVWLCELENQQLFHTEVETPVPQEPVVLAKDTHVISDSDHTDHAGRPDSGAPSTSFGTEIDREVEPKEVKPHETRVPRRSELMEAKLRERGIGSPALPREYLFTAFEEMVSSGEPNTTAQLISQARERAKQAYEADGNSKEQNWPAIAECFLRMLLTAEVLLKADGSPIRNGIGAYSAQVAKLTSNFRDRCEGTLLEVVIKKMGDVSYSELYDLGLTLFHRGRESGPSRERIVERTDFLLDMLHQDGRIEIDEDGRLTTSGSARTAQRLTAVQ